MPDLHDMAANFELLDHVRNGRFDRDEPPPYRSPTPEFDPDDQSLLLIPQSQRRAMMAELDTEVHKADCQNPFWVKFSLHPPYEVVVGYCKLL